MKQKIEYHRSLAVAVLMSNLLVVSIQALYPNTLNSRALAQQPTQTLSEAQIKQLAQSITVKVTSAQNQGSGIILKKTGQIYTVSTNQHVLEPGKPAQIQTADGKTHAAELVKGVNLQGKDLALLQFRSSNNYSVASLGNLATVTVNDTIYSAGFPFAAKPANSGGLVVKTGKVLLVPERAFKEGYQIGYNNEIAKGMSGGPIFNSRGQIIGINGIHAYPLWGNPYVYEDGSKPTDALRDLMSRYSWGIPIQTLARLAPQYTSQTSLPTADALPSSKLPPIANEVNNIAQEITVRIEVPTLRECSGSGVIVAKQGNTYSILTAEHVVRESSKCDRSVLEIIAPDGKQYQVQVSDRNLKTLPDKDLAILQFTSNQNYRVATLASYDIIKDENFIFVSGWRGLQSEAGTTQRQFTAGQLASKQLGSFFAQNSLSLSYGYELIYTNLTEKGMSGSPVLDTRGRVIGIHGNSETQEITDKAGKRRLITLGFSWGIPISSFVRWAQSAGMASMLRVENNAPPKLTAQETKSILEALFQVEKPKDNADAIDWLNYGWQLARNTPEKPLGETQAQEAIRAIERAIELEPKFYQAWYLRGFMQATRTEHQTALKFFEQATQIEPTFTPAWRLRGLMLLSLERYPEALQSFDQLEKLDRNDLSVQTFRALILMSANRFPEALEASNRAVAQNPSSWAYFARGAARTITGDPKGGLADLNEAIRLNPEYIEDTAYSLRGLLRAEQGDFKGAIADANESVRLDPKDASNYKRRAQIRFQQKDYQGVLADLNAALQLQPNDVDALKGRASLRLLQQDYKGAVADLNAALRLAPQDAQIKTMLASANKFLQPSAGDVETIKARGIARLQQQDYKGAVADLSEAIRLKPDTDAYYNRGRAQAQLKEYQKAIADYNQILLAQEFSGIGVQIEINAQTKLPTITKILDNSPAQKSGLKPGDQILVIDGKSTTNLNLDQVIKLVRGQTGTQINLEISRPIDNKLKITATRAPVAVDNKFADVYYHRGLAKMQIKDRQGARQDLQKAADLYQQQGNTKDYQNVLTKIKELQ